MIYVVTMAENTLAGAFDSYEKAKNYCMKLYEEYYKEWADEDDWDAPEEVLSYFDDEQGIDDFVYINEVKLNEEKSYNSLD